MIESSQLARPLELDSHLLFALLPLMLLHLQLLPIIGLNELIRRHGRLIKLTLQHAIQLFCQTGHLWVVVYLTKARL